MFVYACTVSVFVAKKGPKEDWLPVNWVTLSKYRIYLLTYTLKKQQFLVKFYINKYFIVFVSFDLLLYCFQSFFFFWFAQNIISYLW